MRSHFTLHPTIFGARLHLHWSALALSLGLLALWFRHPAEALVVILSYYGVILLHETGHALVARRLGLRPLHITLYVIHGSCTYEHPDTLRQQVLVAWGGVALQLAVAVPLVALAGFTPILKLPLMGIVVAAFGYVSILIAAFNLTPMPGLDGALAWKIFPILVADWRGRAEAKKKTRALLRRLK